MKAAIYARYSSDNQREESIDAQVRAIKEYAEKNGIKIIKIYVDEAKTATTDNRPQFLQMIKDSSLGIFNNIIVHKLDRFSRDRYDSAYYKRILKNNNIKLISVLEHLDNSPESIILESVLEGMAEYYSKNLAREVRKGMNETALQCKHNGGKPPLGYYVAQDKTYIINKTEAEAVKLIFNMYDNDKSYSSIIKELNLRGYKTKLNKPFGKNSLYEILRNEKYTGIYIFNKASAKNCGKRNQHKLKDNSEIIKIENGIPSIIDKDLFNRVRIKMNSNTKAPASNKAKEVYLLSGLVICGDCNGTMVGNRKFAGRKKTLYVTYECCTRKRNKTCTAKSINKQFIENITIDAIEERMLSAQSIDIISKKIYNFAVSESNTISKDISNFEKKLEDINRKINNILDAIDDGIRNSTIKERLTKYEEEKNMINLRIQEAKLELKNNIPSIDMIKSYLLKDINIKTKSLEDQKRIIQTYVQKVVVYEDIIDVHLIVDMYGGGEPYLFIPLSMTLPKIYECYSN